MPETPHQAPSGATPTAAHRNNSGPPMPPAPALEGPRPRLRRLALLRYSAAALIGGGAAGIAFGAEAVTASPWAQAGVLGAGAAVLFGIGIHTAGRADAIDHERDHAADTLHRSAEQLHTALTGVLDAHAVLVQAAGGAAPGERLYERPLPDPHHAANADQALATLIEHTRGLQEIAKRLAAKTQAASVPALEMRGQRRTDRHHMDILLNLARRLQSRVQRSLDDLYQLERQVEHPDLLKGLFGLDLVETIKRREIENLVILAGGPPHRRWSRPIRLYEVVRSAIAEVERYARVKPVLPIEGTLQGHAVVDVTHLLSGLIDNATKFSPPETEVHIRVSPVSAGLAVEIEDRGLGIKDDDRGRLNAMLADPRAVNSEALLADGRIGLYVVAVLAQRHDMAVQLQSNVFGGTSAVVIIRPGIRGDDERAQYDLQVPAAAPDPAPPAAAPALPARPYEPAAPAYQPAAVETGDRPRLPRRAKHSSLPHQLHDMPRAGSMVSETAGDPDLWSSFQSGVHHADRPTSAPPAEEP